MPTELPPIAILGTGSMGSAILSGLLSPDVVVDTGVRVTNRTEAKATALRSPTVKSLATETDGSANLVAIDGARVVIVAVKPAMVADLLKEVADGLDEDAIVISVAAGITIAAMEQVVPNSVLRAMPNTPSTVGLGVTGLSAGARVSEQQLAVASAVFETVGDVLVVPEDQIDALGTISGSGPAYVYYLVEELTRTAVKMGFSEEQARAMVSGTFRGATELLARSGIDPAELRRRVTSPNGTTERAIGVLQDAGLSDLFDRATSAALARTRELAQGH